MAFTHPADQKHLLSSPSIAPPAYNSTSIPIFPVPILDFEDPSFSSDEEEDFSPIHLRINTPLLIKGDSNLISIDATMTASKIAIAVVGALKNMSMGEHGIPMIDENGRPRPISVEVKAETKVEGSRNVVGEKAVVAATVASGVRRKEGGLKRGRAMSEPVEGGGKRMKI